MDLRTELKIPESKYKILLSSSSLTAGSCFAEVVGSKLKENKLRANTNPFGTLFNPLSIFKLLNQSLKNQPIDETLLISNQDSWFHYDWHSQHFATSKEQLIDILNKKITETGEALQKTDFLILTFGSAFIYKLLSGDTYVSNCHKMPGKLFAKELLSVKHICQSFALFYKALKSCNPSVKIIITVSPVRHIKDGIPENQVSKSILRAACHYLETDYEEVSYFPAYELMMDDLRDYRFYKSDLIHPNEIAEDYIFEKFSKSYFSEDLQAFVQNWQKLRSSINHRPFNPGSSNHQQFLNNLLSALENISSKVDVSGEIQEIKDRLI